jgi:hypothetical protein
VTEAAAPSRSQLRASYVWRDEVMEDTVLAEPTPITIGPRHGTTFTVPEVGLPPSFAILRPGSRGYVLTLGTGMTGRVKLGGDEIDVKEFLRGAGGGGAGAQGNFRATNVSPGDWGVIHLDGEGDHSFFFQFVKRDPPLPSGGWRDSELILPALAFALILHAVLLIVAFKFKPDHHSFVFPGDRSLVANYLLNRPLVVEEEEPKPGTEDGEEKVEPASSAGDEGKSGGEGEKERQRAPDPDKGKPDEIIPKSIRKGLLTDKSEKAMKKVLDRGGFDKKLGSALARMQGPLNDGGPGGYGSGTGTGIGDAKDGTGTLTRGGKGGSGGGGTALGDVQTQRAIKTGGTRVAKGTPGGKGVKEVSVKVKTGSPSGNLGGLTKEQILKVVRSRRNAIRACYERELQRTKGLGGKIIVRWKINAAGQVTTAKTASTTMRNNRVEDCIVRQVQRMKFPSPKGGTVAIVNFPFIFSER